ncbi:Integrin Beta-6 [Manis pentadactyla]|nr:Integrin Beta-6 [Manis pentadactyla]
MRLLSLQTSCECQRHLSVDLRPSQLRGGGGVTAACPGHMGDRDWAPSSVSPRQPRFPDRGSEQLSGSAFDSKPKYPEVQPRLQNVNIKPKLTFH